MVRFLVQYFQFYSLVLITAKPSEDTSNHGFKSSVMAYTPPEDTSNHGLQSTVMAYTPPEYTSNHGLKSTVMAYTPPEDKFSHGLQSPNMAYTPSEDTSNDGLQSFHNLEEETIEHRKEDIWVRTKREAKVTACRYENVPWSDCDLSNWMRSKTVKLLLDEQSPVIQECKPIRHFRQTCSLDELPEGTKKYLEDQRQMKTKMDYQRMVLKKSKKFLEDANAAMLRANNIYLHQQLRKKAMCPDRIEASSHVKETKETFENCQKDLAAAHTQLSLVKSRRRLPQQLRNLELNGKTKDWTPEDQANEKIKYYRTVLKKTQTFLEDTQMKVQNSIEDQQKIKERLIYGERVNKKMITYKNLLKDTEKFLEIENSELQAAANPYLRMNENAKDIYTDVHENFKTIQHDSLLHITKLKYKNKITKLKTKLDTLEGQVKYIYKLYSHMTNEKDVDHQFIKVRNSLDFIEDRMRSLSNDHRDITEEHLQKLLECEAKLHHQNINTKIESDKNTKVELQVCHSDIKKIIAGYSTLKQKYDFVKRKDSLEHFVTIQNFSSSENIVQKYSNYFHDVEQQIKESHNKEEFLISTLEQKFSSLFNRSSVFKEKLIQLKQYKDLFDENEKCLLVKRSLSVQLKSSQNQIAKYKNLHLEIENCRSGKNHLSEEYNRIIHQDENCNQEKKFLSMQLQSSKMKLEKYTTIGLQNENCEEDKKLLSMQLQSSKIKIEKCTTIGIQHQNCEEDKKLLYDKYKDIDFQNKKCVQNNNLLSIDFQSTKNKMENCKFQLNNYNNLGQQNENCVKDKNLLSKELAKKQNEVEKYQTQIIDLSKNSKQYEIYKLEVSKYQNMYKVCSENSMKLMNEQNLMKQSIQKLKSNYGSALYTCDLKYTKCTDNLSKKDIEMAHQKQLYTNEIEYLKYHMSETTTQITKDYNDMKTKIDNLRSSLRIMLEKYKKIPAIRNIVKSINKEMDNFGGDLNKLVDKYKNNTKNHINLEKLELCQHKQKHLLTNLVSTFSKLNSHLINFRAGLLKILISKTKSYKQNYMSRMGYIKDLQEKINKQKQSIDAFESQMKSFQKDFLGVSQYNGGLSPFLNGGDEMERILGNLAMIVKGYRAMYENIYSKYQQSQQQIGIIKQKYALDSNCQDELYSLSLQLGSTKNNAFKRGKLLKRVKRFYSYLLRRILRLKSGIYHMRDVGNHLRTNLVSVHSSLGHCTGTMQALRHECHGLVNWYQALPDVDRLKQNLEICQAERKKKCEDVDEMREFSNKMCSYYKKHSASCQEKLTGMVPNIKDLMAVSKTCHKTQDVSEIRNSVLEDYVYGISNSVRLMNKKVDVLVEELKNCKRDQQTFRLKIERKQDTSSSKIANMFPMSDRAIQESKNDPVTTNDQVKDDYEGEFEKLPEGPQFDVGPIKALLDESKKIESQSLKVDQDAKLLYSKLLGQNLPDNSHSQQNRKDSIIEEGGKISKELKHLEHIIEDKLNSSNSGDLIKASDMDDLGDRINNLSGMLKDKLADNSFVIADNQLAENLEQMTKALEDNVDDKNDLAGNKTMSIIDGESTLEDAYSGTEIAFNNNFPTSPELIPSTNLNPSMGSQTELFAMEEENNELGPDGTNEMGEPIDTWAADSRENLEEDIK